MDRREFVKLSLTTALVSSGVSQSLFAEKSGEMQYRTLGRTGEKVSIVGLGGYHIGMQQDASESIGIIRAALDHGMNFMDNCWDYNDGESEVRMGKALQNGYRQKAFLMTKIDGRDHKTAAQQIDESLKRLQTDHIDLLQFHEVIRMSEPEKILGPGGGMEAALAARKAGKIRYIGFTGHKNPDVHLKMLHTAFARNFTFDAVQMPLNVMDAHFESFEKKVLPALVEDKIGVLGMKSMGDSNILASKTVTPVECLHYAMNLPTSVVITGCDSMQILQQALNAASSFRPMNHQEVAALLGKTAQAAQNGRYEPYKTTHDFDGTYQNPEWLGPGQSGATYPQA
ncbi:MAG TPA: aldo/keto reductase [Terriglobales bacterium]|nr:aldo/keto reductase [Terriglobales bacterium]